MKRLTFYIVDVFAETKYTGNQLAVFTDIGTLSAQEMQQIAKEINYSETTFIVSESIKNGGYDVRIFTPKEELPFAGHPTLGTAYILQQEVIKGIAEKITLNLKVGQIPVSFHYLNQDIDLLWMQQKQPIFSQEFAVDTLTEVLNIEPSEIDSKFPIQEVSTGVPFIIVPLKSQATLKRIKVNQDKYFELINNTQAKSILVFCPETYNPENNLGVPCLLNLMKIKLLPFVTKANVGLSVLGLASI